MPAAIVDKPSEQGATLKTRERILDPVSRVSEILFGLIMALTFTCTLSAAEAGREEVRTLLFGAIGCNIAWGLVDAVMYLMNALTGRGRELVTVRAIRAAGSPEQAHGIIRDVLPPVMTAILTGGDLERIRRGALDLTSLPASPRLNRQDWLGAVGVFLLVFLSTFPVVIPFTLFGDVSVAMRASNAVAIALLFASGYTLARYGGFHPWRTGLSMVVLGIVLVAITIALGG
jgi:hypothetical protein